MLSGVADLLAARGRFAVEVPRVPFARLLLAVGAGGSLYGLAMGSFGARWLAGCYSALKLPILVFGATALCVPSFFVLNSLLGLRRDFPSALRGILAAQGSVSLILAALAPVLCVFYLSDIGYPAALLTNGMLFGLSLLGSQCTLYRHYAPLIRQDWRHGLGLLSWAALNSFVSIKLGWILRPFIGDPELPLEFLRADQWMEDPFANLFWAATSLIWKALGLD